MTGFTHTLQGDGLARVQRTLDKLEGDLQRLDRERQRFDNSPPLYKSDRSGTTTRSTSPNPPTEEQQRRQERRIQLGRERRASEPREQFAAQIEEERRRIWNADPRTSWIEINPGDGTFKEEASETVKKRWVEQGIWNNKWNKFASGRWKHEEPLESESETDSKAKDSPLFFFSLKDLQQKPRQPKSDEEKRQIAERRVVREREREASRPFYQFFYQVSKERERIQDEYTSGEGTSVANINTRAYENVKSTWSKRGIWNKRWGVLPGMLWKHEEPLEEEPADGPFLRASLVKDSIHVREAPIINMNRASLKNIFGRPVTNLSENGNFLGNLPSAESNHRQASSVMNTFQQGPSADIDLAGLENGDAERSPSAPNSPRLPAGKRVLRPTVGHMSRSSKRKPSHKEVQPQPVASAPLGPVHSSKISKGALKKRPGPQRRLHISENITSGGPTLSSGVGTAEVPPLPASVAPRRSNRIQPPVPSAAKDPTRTGSTKRAVRSKPERKVESNVIAKSSAKPQGVSKGQPAKNTQGKSRKK